MLGLGRIWKTPATELTDSVTWSDRSIVIRHPKIFSQTEPSKAEPFLRRVLELVELESVEIDRMRGQAELFQRVERACLPDLLGRIASTLRGDPNHIERTDLPPGHGRDRVTIRRHGDRLTTWEVTYDGPGRLRLANEAMQGKPEIARRLERDFVGLYGVNDAQANSRSGSFLVVYDRSILDADRLITLADRVLDRALALLPAPLPSEGKRTILVNTTLALAVVVDFVAPILMPLSVMLLVATNLKTLRSAWKQVATRSLGLPVLYTAIILTTILTGQFLASALMTFAFFFWHRRFRTDLTLERTRLLDASAQPLMARLVTPTGSEIMVDVEQLKSGDRLLIETGETVPADGRIIVGEGVIDERALHIAEGYTHKRPKDIVYAGSTVHSGSFGIEVLRLGDWTRASFLRRDLARATSPTPGGVAPTQKSENYASRAVGPTLATAGVGLLAGDLLTVGAILRPDYATGPGLAVPMETLHDVTICARRGIIIRSSDTFERLSEVDVLVFQDHPALSQAAVEVALITTRLPEHVLLRHAASAYRHMDDERTEALAAECRKRGVHILNLEAVEFDINAGVTVIAGSRRVRVRPRDSSRNALGPLIVEADGIAIGSIDFQRSNEPAAAAVIRELRTITPAKILLSSSRSEAEVAPLAKRLAVDIYRAQIPKPSISSLLQELRARNVKAAFIGACDSEDSFCGEAHLAISLSGRAEDLKTSAADVIIPAQRLGLLTPLMVIARGHVARVRGAHRLILIPNLLCVAGAFLFGFTGLTVVMISNIGTFGLYRRSSSALRDLGQVHRRLPRIVADRFGEEALRGNDH